MTGRSRLVRLAAAAEQEVRAHPALHAAFYRAVRSSPRANAALGRVLTRVRTSGSPVQAAAPALDPAWVAARREALARRLSAGTAP